MTVTCYHKPICATVQAHQNRESSEKTVRAMNDALDLTDTDTIRRIIYTYQGTCMPLNRTTLEVLCQALDTARGHKAVTEAAERQLLKDLAIKWPAGEPFLGIVGDEITKLRRDLHLAKLEAKSEAEEVNRLGERLSHPAFKFIKQALSEGHVVTKLVPPKEAPEGKPRYAGFYCEDYSGPPIQET